MVAGFQSWRRAAQSDLTRELKVVTTGPLGVLGPVTKRRLSVNRRQPERPYNNTFQPQYASSFTLLEGFCSLWRLFLGGHLDQ